MSSDVAIIMSLKSSGCFSPQDINFARFICRAEGNNAEELFIVAALLSNAICERGCVCLDLENLRDSANNWFNGEDYDINRAEIAQLLDKFIKPLDWAALPLKYPRTITVENNGKAEFKPLVLNSSKLYIYRTWAAECTINRIIRQHAVPDAKFNAAAMPNRIAAASPLFAGAEIPDYQQLAVFTALRRQFTIITGGPGTGKTTVAAAVLGLLLERDLNLRIKLCAPTGKAQNRLQEAINHESSKLNVADEVKAALSKLRATTIHRLIGASPETDTCRYNSKFPLPVDVLLADEVSMVSQGLLSKLFTALPENAKIILLGDADQLSSIEAGNVLREICGAAEINAVSKNAKKEMHTVFPDWGDNILPLAKHSHPLQDAVIELVKNRRFSHNDGIGRAAAAIRRLSAMPDEAGIGAALKWLKEDESGQITLKPLLANRQIEEEIIRYCEAVEVNNSGAMSRWREYFRADSFPEAFTLFNKFRILCSHRCGSYGSEGVNAVLEEYFKTAGQNFYQGRPIIIRENCPEKKLYNGDIGLAWPDIGGHIKIHFMTVNELSQPAVYAIEPHNLPRFESAYALTIHKAQGTGFQKILMLLTPNSTLLTRELLYTGITRAEMHAEIWADHNSIRSALENAAKRHSGLMTRMRSTI
jgi:exodeoxyribonuclease V alpha subunit